MKDIEHKLFDEKHTKDILKDEKKVFETKIGKLKTENQQLSR